MTYIVEEEITVLGGLPVVCKAWFSPAEPDVGIFQTYMSDYELYWVPSKNGKLHNVPTSIYDRVESSKYGLEEIEEQLYAAGEELRL